MHAEVVAYDPRLVITAATKIESVYLLRHIFNPNVQQLGLHSPAPKFIWMQQVISQSQLYAQYYHASMCVQFIYLNLKQFFL